MPGHVNYVDIVDIPIVLVFEYEYFNVKSVYIYSVLRMQIFAFKN